MRRPQLTIRARFTLICGGLLLASGAAILGITYVLLDRQPPSQDFTSAGHTPSAPSQPGTVRTPPPSMDFQVADNAQRAVLNRLVTQGAIALVVVVAVAGASGWVLAGRTLGPLQRITETARRIADAPAADRELHERIALDGPADEVKRLADTFDVMLERLDHSFEGQRRFIANASHELRTPLTLNRTLLEVATDADEVAPEVRHLSTTLLAINARHEQLINGLLLLARSENELMERSYVDLADIVDHVAGQLPAGEVTVKVDANEAPVSGNPVLLERLVQNLVENAVRYNIADGGWVRVSSRPGPDGGGVIVVSNSGPVVPPYEVPSLFEPFRRLGPSRPSSGAAGAGLGLSIVRAVARAHGGDARADSRDGGGLVVTVTLPR
ncbi:sensor histidine kinase [Kribbella solani]|uniref:sensor histidine kinase n=1 Tax=Kribbella solani TaxID=236067 RepID=UPI0029A182D8|nr:HAMP domain-containing sensor histidine kinase [Kribbella solani]MDX2971304.1 HAMP domain-containing sensor histidine kinase [Kribbella solani]